MTGTYTFMIYSRLFRLLPWPFRIIKATSRPDLTWLEAYDYGIKFLNRGALAVVIERPFADPVHLTQASIR